jgi:signal transduction histidine kinase
VVRRFPIRAKLTVALAVPLTALVVVAALEALLISREAHQVRQQSELARSSIGPGSLLRQIQNERNIATISLLGAVDMIELQVEDNAVARRNTDTAAAEFESQVERRGGKVEQAYRPALDGLDALVELRDDVDDFSGTRDLKNVAFTTETFDRYTSLLDALFDANTAVALAVDNPDLRRGAELIDVTARQSDVLAKLVTQLVVAGAGGDADGLNTPAEIARIAALRAELAANEQAIAANPSPTYRPLVEDLFANEPVQQFPKVVDAALQTGTVSIPEVLRTVTGDDIEKFGYIVFRNEVSDEIRHKADALTSAAETRERVYLGFAGLAILLAAVVAGLVSRSITRPLEALTSQATDMAGHRLPEAVSQILSTPLGDDVTLPEVDRVRVKSRDEVADVADALTTVQDSALDLAIEQAVLRRNIADSFVNLGRRNQALLGRQLDFITELEHRETEPDPLADLFRLDHLATRMRRNAESLLVLAGVDQPRTWSAPVLVTEAIRAALGEVEDYQRVVVRAMEPATISGSAAADLAHLLAELIENALAFSPPDEIVEIRGGSQRSGYTLVVIDCGLGMPDDELESANRRLAGAEAFTIAPSRYLGHYVAGTLAARHGITVTLQSRDHGTTATVNLPPALLAADPTASPDRHRRARPRSLTTGFPGGTRPVAAVGDG